MEALELYKSKITNAIQVNGNRIPTDLLPKTKEESVLLMTFNAGAYYNSMKVYEIRDVLNSNVCSVALLQKESGEMIVRASIVYILTDLVMFFNVGKTMNEHQIAQVTDMIIDEFYYLKFDDFKLCFNNAKKGLYGETYGMDGSVIFKWLNQYVCERDNTCIEININDKPDNEVSDEVYKQHLKSLEKAFEMKNKSRR